MDKLGLRDELVPFLGRGVRGAVLSFWEPALATMAFVFFSMFANRSLGAFEIVFGLYFGFLVLFALRTFVHSKKSWAVLAVFAILTALLLVGGFFGAYAEALRGLLGIASPGDPCASHGNDLGVWFGCTFGVGLVEESFKALPLLAAVGLTLWIARTRAGFAHRAAPFSLATPADGLVLGCTVGIAFTLIETLGQYVPQAASQDGIAMGLATELVRLPSTFFGHVAWTAYLGFALGEAVGERDRGRRITIAILAFAIVAMLHGTWDAFNDNLFVLAPIAALSIAMLYGAAISARRGTDPSEPEPQLAAA
ncbi:MAG: PrsW family glutamic-type intramembrane protease [Vulcanimicrobiaceae bacterium]